MSAWLELELPVRGRELPAAGVIECWLMDLGELELPAAESADGQRRQVLRLRRQFLLRLILGACLQRPGKDIDLVRGASGKPELAPALAASALQFNLSHSGNWMAVALARDVAVGVDIEQRRRVQRALDLARRYFSPAEAAGLEELAKESRSDAFFRLWTVREACIKAMGSSLAQSLRELALAPHSAEPIAMPEAWPAPAHWTLASPAIPAPLHICIAAPRPGMVVELIRLHCRPR